MGSVCLNAWVAVVRFCRAACLSPRERLDSIWRVFAHLLLGSAFIVAFNRIIILVTAPADDERRSLRSWIVPVCMFVFLGAAGLLCGWPNFRMRAQAKLSSRGETKLL